MRSEALLLYFTLLKIARAGFPEDSEPISISHGNYTKQYPAFFGHKPGRNNTQRHKLDIQLIIIMNRTLYIAARDHIYTLDTDTANSEEIFFNKKLTWKSRQADVDTCRMKGKHKDECHNFIKVLLQQNDDTLFVCGTNAFNPSCRTYKMDTMEHLGEEISGMARCPYDAKHSNIALFAGVIRESYQKGRDQLVPVTLLAIAVIMAFAMGAIFSGILVYCVCDHRRRDIELSGRKDKDHDRRGSMNSVTKLTGLFETGAKDSRPEAILTPLMHNGRLTNGKILIKADQHHLDLAGMPTPESTPMQPRRKPSRGSREWERNQNLINACTKDLQTMGSPVIPTDLPLRASPGHIPSVVVLPLPQHQHQQPYQHEYVEQPHRSDLSQMSLGDQGATLEYKSLKSPCHSLNLVESDGLPPRVPQREASLTIPPAVPQMGKRLEVHSSVYGHEYKRGYPMSAQKGSALKKHNTNSSNSSHLSRHQSFNHVESPPPAPQRVDSMHMNSQGMSHSRQPSMSSYGSLPRTGVKHLKPDVPPKPSLVSLSTKVNSNDSCT